MVFKRPYAFLIKHFKIIHLIFLSAILFITYGFSRIVNNFSSYVKYNNISNNTLSFTLLFMLILTIVVILFSILMWRLMSQKNKPYRYYLFAAIYFFIILIASIHALNVLNGLDEISLTQKASRAYRDIYEILFIPNFYFIIISLIRGIGFDIKRFNFGKDLNELEISSADSEEVEFVLGNDAYKFKRKFRRSIRELKYYFLENKLFILIIIGSLLAIALLVLFINYTFFRKVYKVGNKMKTDDFTYILNNAYISSYDYSGKIIKNDKNYLVLDFSVKSNGLPAVIKPENFYIKLNNNILTYKTTLSNSFSDLGISYDNSKIGNEYQSYLFIFEYDSNYKGSHFNLSVLDKIKYNSKEDDYIFKRYSIKAKKLDKLHNTQKGELNKIFYLDNALYGNTNITIKKIEIKPVFEYQYKICDKINECYLSSGIELPSNSIKNNVLSIEYELNIDDKYKISDSIKNSYSFFDKFLKVEYVSNNKIYKESIATHKNDLIDGRVFADIPKQISTSDSVDLTVSTRTNNYSIKIK